MIGDWRVAVGIFRRIKEPMNFKEHDKHDQSQKIKRDV